MLASLLRPDAIEGGASDCCVVRFHCAPSDVLFLPQDPYFAEVWQGLSTINVIYVTSMASIPLNVRELSLRTSVTRGLGLVLPWKAPPQASWRLFQRKEIGAQVVAIALDSANGSDQT